MTATAIEPEVLEAIARLSQPHEADVRHVLAHLSNPIWHTHTPEAKAEWIKYAKWVEAQDIPDSVRGAIARHRVWAEQNKVAARF